MERDAPIYVAGAETLIGTAIVRALDQAGYQHTVAPSGKEPSLNDAEAVEEFFRTRKPAYVFVAAGRSGGIQANQLYPADLMLDNLRIACHVIEAAFRHRVRKLLYLASSCCYPVGCPQPMAVEALMSGPVEPTSEAYAVAKIAGIRLCQAFHRQYGAPFITGIPADVFGPDATFDAEHSHVIPALIVKMHEAREQGLDHVTLWGTGRPRREFMPADDLASACLFVMDHYAAPEPINLGGGTELSIREVAARIREVVGFRGTIEFDTSRPDGMPRKLLDSTPLRRLGWRPQMDFRDALRRTYESYRQHLGAPPD